MATLVDSGFPNLLNLTKRLRPDGSVETDIAELLNKKLPFIEDVPWREANGATGHIVTSRTGLPAPTWRAFNEGVDATKSETEQYVESIGILEDYSIVDKDLAELNGNAAAFRLSEDNAKIESFGQEIERSFLYESILTAPKKIHGLTPRYPATTGYVSSDYVIKVGTLNGSNCHSIWLINWDPDSLFGIYPKGGAPGLQKRDLGEDTVVSPINGKQMQAYRTHLQWKAGLCVRDYRKAVRIQWDPDDAANADSAKTIYLALQQAIDTVHDLGPNARFYMDRVSRAKLNAQLASNSANFLEYIEMGGRRVASFMGVPIRISDTLTGETAIS